MSFLELASAAIPDMNKGVISLWFRDPRKNFAPSAVNWPDGLWTAGTSSMVPPDVYGMVATQAQWKQNVFYWNSYGRYITTPQGLTLPIFGGPPVMMPSPPPFVTNGMHMMLTFGKPDLPYNYYPWTTKPADVIEAVQYVPQLVPGPQWSVPHDPPPYAPYIRQYGKFKPVIMVLAEAAAPRQNFVPQSFIGVDAQGYLTIHLQTATAARYRGYAYQLSKMTPIWATATYFDAPVHQSLGPGHWVKVPGYWDGYQFEYQDISNQIMGAAPESFTLGGPPGGVFEIGNSIPPVRDGAWHHLLFSFDISGPVGVVRLSRPAGSTVAPPPIAQSQCRAWLALDDINFRDAALQTRFKVHDNLLGFALLAGMGTDALGTGPVTTQRRSDFIGLGANDILPRNCWIMPLRGSNPKDDLLRFVSSSGLWENESNQFIQKGDFNFFRWTGSIFTLEAAGGKDTWAGSLDPPRPTVPDPKTFLPPTYDCNGFIIRAKNYPIGIPAGIRHIEHNTGIEMAELQIWANKTIDTSITAVRRLFISERGTPVSPTIAAKVLGVPDVLLHGSGNWIRGHNAGNAGNFIPIAKIRSFQPNPKLGK